MLVKLSVLSISRPHTHPRQLERDFWQSVADALQNETQRPSPRSGKNILPSFILCRPSPREFPQLCIIAPRPHHSNFLSADRTCPPV